jgi:transposase
MSDEQKIGRPSLLTPEAKAKLLEAIRAGASREAACAAAGISASTLLRWLRYGRQNEEGEFRELLDEVREAEASLEVEVLEQVRRDLPRDPRTALLFLARRFPRRWGPRVNVTVERELTDFLKRVEARLSPELFRIVLDESIAVLEAEEAEGSIEPAGLLADESDGGKLPQ